MITRYFDYQLDYKLKYCTDSTPKANLNISKQYTLLWSNRRQWPHLTVDWGVQSAERRPVMRRWTKKDLPRPVRNARVTQCPESEWRREAVAKQRGWVNGTEQRTKAAGQRNVTIWRWPSAAKVTAAQAFWPAQAQSSKQYNWIQTETRFE